MKYEDEANKIVSSKIGKNSLATALKESKTGRKSSKETLEVQRERLLSILDGIPALVYLQAPDHSIRFANYYFRKHIGEPEGKHCYEVFWRRNKPCEDCPPLRVLDTNVPQEWEWFQPTTGRTYQIYDYPFTDTDGSPLVVELGIDITRRKQMETERERLEKEIMKISSRERWQIGQDLHDGLGQVLTGITFMSKVLEQKLVAKSLPEASDAAEIVELVNQAIVQVQNLAGGLCPVELEAEGLTSALGELASSLERMFGISCFFKCDKPIPIHDNTIARHFYYIAKEAISNAIKHGRAKHILVGLNAVDGGMTLTVKDNGSGFPKESQNKGMGLRIMKYRAGTIGASLDVRRDAAGGTILICSLQNMNAKNRVGISHGNGRTA